MRRDAYARASYTIYSCFSFIWLDTFLVQSHNQPKQKQNKTKIKICSIAIHMFVFGCLYFISFLSFLLELVISEERQTKRKTKRKKADLCTLFGLFSAFSFDISVSSSSSSLFNFISIRRVAFNSLSLYVAAGVLIYLLHIAFLSFISTYFLYACKNFLHLALDFIPSFILMGQHRT